MAFPRIASVSITSTAMNRLFGLNGTYANMSLLVFEMRPFAHRALIWEYRCTTTRHVNSPLLPSIYYVEGYSRIYVTCSCPAHPDQGQLQESVKGGREGGGYCRGRHRISERGVGGGGLLSTKTWCVRFQLEVSFVRPSSVSRCMANLIATSSRLIQCLLKTTKNIHNIPCLMSRQMHVKLNHKFR